MLVFGQWLLLILYSLMGIANVARGILEFLVAPAFASRAVSLPLPLLGTVYILWGIVFVVAGAMFFSKLTSATRWFAGGVGLAYQITVWIIHFVGDLAAYPRALWLRDGLLSVLFLIAVLILTLMPARQKPARGR